MQHFPATAATKAVLIALALAMPAAVAQPPTAANPAQQTAKPKDPLLEALDRLRDDIRQLRGEVRSAAKRPAAMEDDDASPAVDQALPGVPANPPPLALTPAAPRQATPAPSDHWSFQPVRSPPLPAVTDETWVKRDLDRFVLARLQAAGITPNPDAPRHLLLRRIALDLTGLPPSEVEIEELVDESLPLDDALNVAVDRYLDSPRYGERWGRHWLDVVRYADSVGRTWNAPFTYAWRYRDYVIDALNKDKPYDRFILEQLAGDLLPAASSEEHREHLIATGFLTLGSMSLNDGRLEGFLMDRVDEQLDVTSRAFLGLTIACARCHDHKYDAVTMRDYYALAGIFYSTQTFPGQGHLGELGRGGYVDAQRLVRLPPLPGAAPLAPADAVHSMSDYREASQRLRDEARYTFDPDLAMGVAEGDVRDCDLRIGGDAYERAESVPRGEHRIAGLPLLPVIPADASGRLQLAQWITSPKNPLTARVIVNRVWQHLLGKGLVPTVDDFGASGQSPTDGALLDHLATRFIDEGWSLKRLIRNIVLSRTYRQSSAGNAAAQAVDPANELYWRSEPRRLEMEVLRDCLLHAAGRLSAQRPEGIQVAGTGGKGRTAVARSLLPIDAPYRTIYLPVLRSSLPDLYDAFDFPDPCQLTGQRPVTTVATQALFFLNGELVDDCATEAAQRLLAEPGIDNTARVQRLYLAILARPARPSEVAAALKLLADLKPTADEPDPQLYRWTTLVSALFASGEFRYAL